MTAWDGSVPTAVPVGTAILVHQCQRGREGVSAFRRKFRFCRKFRSYLLKISVLYALQYMVGTGYPVPGILRKSFGFAENFCFDEVPDASGTYHVL